MTSQNSCQTFTVSKPQAPLVIDANVVDSHTGDPINEFKAFMSIITGSGNEPCVPRQPKYSIDGKDGRCEAVYEDPYYMTSLLIEAEGYRPQFTDYYPADSGKVSCTVKLEKAPYIEGRILTPQGQPAEAATLFVKSTGGQLYITNGTTPHPSVSFHAQIETDKQGRFKMLPRVIEGIYIIHKSGYKLLDANPTTESLNPVILDKWATIEGTAFVRDKPYANSSMALGVSLIESEPIGLFEYEVKTDSFGNFKFENVIAKNHLYVSKCIIPNDKLPSCGSSDMPLLMQNKTAIDIKPGDHIKSLIVGGKGRKVTGKLIIQNATNSINWLDGYNDFISVNNLNIALHPMLKEIKSRWPQKTTDEHQASYPFVCNTDGSFAIEDIPAGNYNLRIRLFEPNCSPYRCSNYDLTKPTVDFHAKIKIPDGSNKQSVNLGEIPVVPNNNGMEYYGIDINDTKYAKLKGKVVDPSGNAAIGADLAICYQNEKLTIIDFQNNEQNLTIVKTDNQGMFEIQCMANEFHIFIQHEDGFAILTQKDFFHGLPSIKLTPFAKVEGKLNCTDQMNAGQKVLLGLHSKAFLAPNIAIGMEFETTTDTNGNFVFEKVLPGTFILGRLQDDRNFSVAKCITAKAGENVSVTLSDSGITVTGKINFSPVGYADNLDSEIYMANLIPIIEQEDGMADFPTPPKDTEDTFEWYLDWMETQQGCEFIEKYASYAIEHKVNIEKDGSFVARDLTPGKYKFRVYINPERNQKCFNIKNLCDFKHEVTILNKNDGNRCDLGNFDLILNAPIPSK